METRKAEEVDVVFSGTCEYADGTAEQHTFCMPLGTAEVPDRVHVVRDGLVYSFRRVSEDACVEHLWRQDGEPWAVGSFLR